MTEPTVLYSAGRRGARPWQALNSFTRQMHRRPGPHWTRPKRTRSIRALLAGRGFAPVPTWRSLTSPDPVWWSAPTRVRSSIRRSTPRRGACRNYCACRPSQPSTVWPPAPGASLAMTCDIAIAAAGASFIQAFSKIGLIPGRRQHFCCCRVAGLARAMALAMTGDKLPAAPPKSGGDLGRGRRRDRRMWPRPWPWQKAGAMPTKALE